MRIGESTAGTSTIRISRPAAPDCCLALEFSGQHRRAGTKKGRPPGFTDSSRFFGRAGSRSCVSSLQRPGGRQQGGAAGRRRYICIVDQALTLQIVSYLSRNYPGAAPGPVALANSGKAGGTAL